jgi:hypothetical protein
MAPPLACCWHIYSGDCVEEHVGFGGVYTMQSPKTYDRGWKYFRISRGHVESEKRVVSLLRTITESRI